MMLLLASALALVLLYLDQRFDPGPRSSITWAYSGGPDGARSLLSAIAGSMIIAGSVTFSLASVALSIASQHTALACYVISCEIASPGSC
jgi:uncharacterized membrane protein